MVNIYLNFAFYQMQKTLKQRMQDLKEEADDDDPEEKILITDQRRIKFNRRIKFFIQTASLFWTVM